MPFYALIITLFIVSISSFLLVCIAATALTAIFGILFGIVLLAQGSLASGFTYLFLFPILSWFLWLVMRLAMSFMCDVKLIRNKMYGTDCEMLKVFLQDDNIPGLPPSETEGPIQPLIPQNDEARAVAFTILEKLKGKGKISENDYALLRGELLKNDPNMIGDVIKHTEDEDDE